MEGYNIIPSVLQSRKSRTVLMTLPATAVAVVGIVVLIPAIVWVRNQYNDATYDPTERDVVHVYLSPNYLLIATQFIYFPLHMALAFTGHWIIHMASVFIGCVSIVSGGCSMFYYGVTIWANDRYSPEYHDLHFDLGFAGCFLSTLAVAASITMIPLLTKYRERANAGAVPYAPLSVGDNYSTPSVSVPPQGTFQPLPGAGRGPSMVYAPHSHPPLPPYSHTDYAGQNYPTQLPQGAPEPGDGHGKDNQPQAELQPLPVAPSAPPPMQ